MVYRPAHGLRRRQLHSFGVALKRALATHGAESFRRDTLRFHCGDRESLCQEEERILIELDAAGDRQSYNMKNKGLGQDPGFVSALFKGVPKSRDSVQRQRDTLMKSGKVRGINNPRARQVVNLNTHGVYPYGGLAAKAVHGTGMGISEACLLARSRERTETSSSILKNTPSRLDA